MRVLKDSYLYFVYKYFISNELKSGWICFPASNLNFEFFIKIQQFKIMDLLAQIVFLF